MQNQPFTAVQMVGTQRSGSNLLRLMLNQLESVSAPHPPHILERFVPLLPAYGNLNDRSDFLELATDICKLIECNPVPWDGMELSGEKIISRCHKNSIEEIFRVVYELRAGSQNAHIWICKSMVNIQFVDLLEPDIKPLYLHLFRDGRDVALSFMKAIVGEKHIYFIAKQWREEQEAAISLMENIDSKRFAQVRYENLLANPEREIKTICSFIGADYDPSVLSFFKSNESINTAHSGEMWKNVEKPILKDNFNKFTREMSAADIQLFEQVAGETLVKLGYPLQFPANNTPFTQDQVNEFSAINDQRKKDIRSKIKAEDLEKRQRQDDLLKSIRCRVPNY